MTGDDLVRLYRHGSAERRAVDRSDCVSPDALLAIVEQRASDDERLRSLDHAKACTHCTEELEIMRATRVVRERARIPHAGFALITSVLIVGVLGYYSIAGRTSATMEPLGRIARSPVQLVSPDSFTARVDSLVWHPVPEASSYGVELRRDDGTLITSASTMDTAFVVPDTVGIAPGSDVVWTVSARMADGSERHSTPRRTHLTTP